MAITALHQLMALADKIMLGVHLVPEVTAAPMAAEAVAGVIPVVAELVVPAEDSAVEVAERMVMALEATATQLPEESVQALLPLPVAMKADVHGQVRPEDLVAVAAETPVPAAEVTEAVAAVETADAETPMPEEAVAAEFALTPCRQAGRLATLRYGCLMKAAEKPAAPNAPVTVG